ncbi:EmrB/QacA subfamily drug resistance transporter [Pseudochelatococcus lubricantis]|uniref:EmrB/QacA subfamily drug resistance transporter n=3 Tax=Pseudochelatococcus lubricantis TaxID=1538102 RepID=A0ABX0V3V4_9HYPH|nr:MFS transporter [Pseudochelatococcus lubricantis]NIJ59278.1 EmrB/QacA subfamily drug resistance transporter [Pseudochelatococcus lubricantis]
MEQDFLQEAPDPKRWSALTFIAIATAMMVLDGSIINIALPQAQADLGISDVHRPWVVTAYALTFGGLLLLGGRISDFFGRRRVFIIGMCGFLAASAFGGFAVDGVSLIAARALQGGFAALLAPAALSLLTTTFTEPGERAKAFSVYGAVQGFGAAVGMLLGGILTEYLGWRWCLFINVPIALVVILGALGSIRESRAEAAGPFDIPGALLSMLGLASLVYGFTLAGEAGGWFAPITSTSVLAGVILLIAFALRSAKASFPLLPPRIFMNRNRGAAFLSFLLVGAGILGVSLFLTFYLQVTLGFTPFQAGIAFLPFTIGIVAGAMIASGLTPRFGEVKVMILGLGIALLNMIWLAQVSETSGFLSLVLPALTLMSLGLGLYFAPASSLALLEVDETDSGVASALVNATQQVGGALGSAMLNTIFLSAVAGGKLAGTASDIGAYRITFASTAGLFALALVVVLLLAKQKRSRS